nr:hypothetical protein Iba_chr07bCG7870 [Ipomoea batatas]
MELMMLVARLSANIFHGHLLTAFGAAKVGKVALMGLEDWNVWWQNSEAAMRMNGGSLYLVIYDFTININVTLNT